MEQVIAQLVELIVAAAMGAVASTVLTWIRYLPIGISEGDAANISGHAAELVGAILAAVSPLFFYWVFGLIGIGPGVPDSEIVTALPFLAIVGSRVNYISRKRAGLRT